MYSRELLAAAQRIVLRGDAADAAVRLAACSVRGSAREVWVKHENHTPVGAFKVRGGLVYFDRLRSASPDVPRRHHRDARQPWPVASALPRGATASPRRSSCRTATRSRRTRRCARSASTLIEHGDDFQAAREHARRVPPSARLHMRALVPRATSCAACATLLGRSSSRLAGAGDARGRLRADRPGLGHLRLRGRARRTGAQDAHRRRRVGACDRLSRTRSRARHAVEAPVTTCCRRHGLPHAGAEALRSSAARGRRHRRGDRRRSRATRCARCSPTRTTSPRAPAPPPWPRRSQQRERWRRPRVGVPLTRRQRRQSTCSRGCWRSADHGRAAPQARHPGGAASTRRRTPIRRSYGSSSPAHLHSSAGRQLARVRACQDFARSGFCARASAVYRRTTTKAEATRAARQRAGELDQSTRRLRLVSGGCAMSTCCSAGPSLPRRAWRLVLRTMLSISVSCSFSSRRARM